MSTVTRVFTPDELEEVFPNPPLREVAFEIRFTPRLRVQAEIWRLQDQLVNRYPQVSAESAIQPNGAVLNVSVFQDPEGGRVIKVSAQNFVIAFSRYTRFEEFKEEVCERMQQFCSTFGISSFTRLGLRYVNEIALPTTDPESLLKYVKPMADFRRFPIQQVEQFATELRAEYRGHMITLRGVLLPGLLRTYILDIDCHTESERAATEYPRLMDDFHDSAQRLFLDHITEDYKAIMRGAR